MYVLFLYKLSSSHIFITEYTAGRAMVRPRNPRPCEERRLSTSQIHGWELRLQSGGGMVNVRIWGLLGDLSLTVV
jgi:hypothetical protein